MFCLCVSGRMEPSADRTKIEITHCNTVFQPISNKCLSRGHSFSWCEELWALWCEEMGFMGYQVKQLMVRGSARSQGWDPAAPPRAMNGTELLSPELETQTCTRWSTRAGTGGSHRHGVFFRDPKSNEIQCSFYFFFYSVIGFQSPLACPSLELQTPLQGSVPAEAPLQQPWPLWEGWGCSTAIPWTQTWETRKRQRAEAFMCPPAAFLSESRSDFIPERSHCSSKDCEIVACSVTVNGRAAGPAGMALPEQLTAVHQGGRCGIWHPLLPQHSRGEAAFSALSGQTPFQAWITCTAPADGQVLFYTSFSQKECQNVLGWIYKILYFITQPNCKSNTQIFDPCYWLTRENLHGQDSADSVADDVCMYQGVEKQRAGSTWNFYLIFVTVGAADPACVYECNFCTSLCHF